ncbi:MAG: zinc ribbon domain-containing protein [Eubacterium sp.]|jgi:hypothetical protein|nr:zinc ribbon domain-containing protein [Eubacterium sp.]
MYCRNCGNSIPEKSIHCIKCGAKQKVEITQKIKESRLQELNIHAKSIKRQIKIARNIIFISLVIAIILIVIIFFREAPDTIPDINTVPYSPYGMNDCMRYGDENTQKYWSQNREMLDVFILCIFICIGSKVYHFVQKIKYKKILRRIMEVKNNVL